ncbi:MAG: sugar ABC transporter ATP-binding protein [Flexilinea sp.]
MSDTVLKVTDVTKRFGGVCALDNVSLEIKKGEIHCLVGGNGSGKSTLIKVVSGFYKPDSGSVEINGVMRHRYNTMDAITSGIQVIYQDLSVFPNLTVAENIAITVNKSSNKKFVNWKKMDEIAKLAFEKIGVDLPLHELLENLSVADKQIVAIARAILYDAKLLIMDEPTTALTRKEIDKLFEIIRNLQSQGVSILFVSHKLDEVFEIATRFTVLRNGKNVITDITSNANNEKMVFYMSGRKLSGDNFSCEISANDTPLFEVNSLCLKNAFEDISFKVMPGEILGITGLLGSGRTELAMSLFGLYPADSGEIKIKGKTVKINSPQDALKHKIAYVPEDRLTEGLFLLQSIRNNISIANLDALSDKSGRVDESAVERDAIKWTENLSIIFRDIEDAIGTLSGGNQQKVVLAKWLETNPDVLVLNGPTVGVDIGAKFDLHAHIRNIVKDKTTAVIIISDDLLEVIQNCNRILVVKKGRITDELTNEALNEGKLLSIVTASHKGGESVEKASE